MKKRGAIIACLLAGMLVFCGCAEQNQGNAGGSVSSAESSAETPADEADEADTADAAVSASVSGVTNVETDGEGEASGTETETFEEVKVTGVVIDATMSGLVIQSEKDGTIRFVYGENLDDSALADGVRLGYGITVTYAGGGEESVHTAVTLEDAGIACGEPEALMAAGEAILTLEAGGPENLMYLFAYPLQVGDETFENEAELKERLSRSGENGFTLMGENCVKAVTEANLNAVPLSNDNEISLNDATGAGVYIERVNYEWKITMIHP